MSRPAPSAALGRLARAADPDPPADGRLVARFARTRCSDSFAELVQRLGPMVLGVCRRVTGDAHLADDAFQAAFLVLARRAADVAPADGVRGWLYGVAVRVAREARTVSARRRAREEPVPHVPDRPAESYTPPDADALRALDEEVAALPDHLRAAVVLCELDGVARKAAAGRLGVPEGTLSSRLAKGRKLLAERLRKRGVTAPAAGLAVLVPAAVPPRLVAAASAFGSGGPAPAGVASLASGVVRAMFLTKLKAVSVAVGVCVAAAVAVGSAAGPAPLPRPAAPAVRVAQPPAPPAKAAPAALPGIVVGRVGAGWRFAPDGTKLGEVALPKELRDPAGAAVPAGGLRYGSGIVLSPDGTRYAAVAHVPARPEAGPPDFGKPFPLKLVVGSVAGGAATVFDLPGYTLEPHWTPDGRAVLIARATEHHRMTYQTHLLDPATGKLAPVAVEPDCRVLDIGRDGKTYLVEYRPDVKTPAKLALVAAGGTGVKVLTDLKTPPGFITGRFSPDGKRVLFTDGDPDRADAHKWGRSHRPFVLDVAARTRAPLADFPENGQATGVAWSPDGTRVAYTWTQLHPELLATDRISGDDALRETEGFVIVADADGRNARTLATDTSPFAGNLVFGKIDWR